MRTKENMKQIENTRTIERNPFKSVIKINRLEIPFKSHRLKKQFSQLDVTALDSHLSKKQLKFVKKILGK